MSADGSITLTWADGDYKFRTDLGGWREIQEKCGCGLIEIMDRLQDRRWRVDDIREPIRVGLIGGGMTPTQALGLVRLYVDQRPLAESIPIAMTVVMAAIVGLPDDPADGDRSKKNDEPETGGTENSSSPGSTDPEPSSDSRRKKSMV